MVALAFFSTLAERETHLATQEKPIVSFAKLTSGMDQPNLLDVQLRAFETLLQTDAAAREREDVGLERVFNEIFPITDVNGNFSLEFVRYTLGEPKYDMEECMERDMTYAAPLKATLRLVVWEDVGDERRPKDIIEKEVYLGDLPVLTPLGTFIINGAERVIVSPAAPLAGRGVRGEHPPQRHRSCTARGSSPSAARGWSSRSTSTT